VTSGEWQPHQRILTEHELARQFKVSRGTVIRSLRQLEREGLLRSRRGAGRFVVDPAERKRRSATIAFVIPDITRLTHPVTADYVEGIREVCLDERLHLELLGLNPRVEDHALPHLLERLEDRRLDGIIIIDSWLIPEDRLLALSQHTHTVVFSRTVAGGRVGRVCFDMSGGSLDAANHLVSLGHTRIALVTVDQIRFQGQTQQEGVRLAMRQLIADGRGRFDVITGPNNRATSWFDAFTDLMSRPDRPTAVIFGSDDLAENGLRLISNLKLEIPRDISVISANDTLHPPHVPVPLTTVRLNYKLAGREAARMLLEMMDNPAQTPEQRIVPTQLIVRESTAAPARIA
jgi:DNA-binding LacI/PurR family transcriptional regulator